MTERANDEQTGTASHAGGLVVLGLVLIGAAIGMYAAGVGYFLTPVLLFGIWALVAAARRANTGQSSRQTPGRHHR